MTQMLAQDTAAYSISPSQGDSFPGLIMSPVEASVYQSLQQFAAEGMEQMLPASSNGMPMAPTAAQIAKMQAVLQRRNDPVHGEVATRAQSRSYI